ncbi:MAG TPA: hypothetical protein VGI75_12480, partial [Pirellulales bacterium]
FEDDPIPATAHSKLGDVANLEPAAGRNIADRVTMERVPGMEAARANVFSRTSSSANGFRDANPRESLATESAPRESPSHEVTRR